MKSFCRGNISFYFWIVSFFGWIYVYCRMTGPFYYKTFLSYLSVYEYVFYLFFRDFAF